MTEPDPPAGGEHPPAAVRRRLDRAPGERFVAEKPAGVPSEPAPLDLRGVLLVVGGAVGGAVAILLVAGVMATTTGVLFVSGFAALLVGEGVRGAVAGRQARRAGWLAAAIALAMVALGDVATWVYALGEGGVLGLPDFLAETLGPGLLAAQAGIAIVAAWLSARRGGEA